ncbi:MAG: Eco57I restriction-modification methylase domain-containing protein [Desulfosalsimonas sp.]
MLAEVEQTRLAASKETDPKRKSQLGQFFTPASIARFMADLFAPARNKKCVLLDPGAGIGSLSAAFLERWSAGGLDFDEVELHAFEVDESLHPYLSQTLEACGKKGQVTSVIRSDDFVIAAANWLENNFFASPLPEFTHVILNPPYRKIRSDSVHRLALRSVGIETVNLYSAFVALSLALLENHGQLVAIIPRSFCNGLYYRPFREYMMQRAAIRHIHLFASRSKAFKDDDVLQENIIIRLERGGAPGPVSVSTSTDDSFADLIVQEYPFDRIVSDQDPERFIHVPASPEKNIIERCPAICCSLADLGIAVSTGPVVDFRVKKHLREMPDTDSVPLLYPGHFSSKGAEWPKEWKKPNAICRHEDTEKWLYPNGFYCVVRRFSSKEEKRRVVAGVVVPSDFGDAPLLGFENHLNVFHENKQGLLPELAHGLAVFLNTTAVDEHFRLFNGHTQVNATDLKSLQYPDRETLTAIGKWALGHTELTQEMIDSYFEALAA